MLKVDYCSIHKCDDDRLNFCLPASQSRDCFVPGGWPGAGVTAGAPRCTLCCPYFLVHLASSYSQLASSWATRSLQTNPKSGRMDESLFIFSLVVFFFW